MGKLTSRERTPFGARMYGARKSAGLTQVEVAKKLGIGQTTVVDAESSAKGVPWVVEAAKLYKVSVEWLASGSGKETDPYVSDDVGWPFMDIDPDRWAALDDRQKGRLEEAFIQSLQRIEGESRAQSSSPAESAETELAKPRKLSA